MKSFENITCRILARHYRKKGFSPYGANSVATDITEELFKNECKMPLRSRIWSWKKGFTASQSKMFNLTEDNYKDYLSNTDYMKLYPLNNQFHWWVDDKLTLRYLLSKYSEYLPKYYFSIRKTGEFNKLMDWPDEIMASDFESIITLLKQKGVIAAKLNTGSAGKGFYKLEYKNNKIYVNEKEFNEQDFLKLIKTLKGYVFTEFINQSDIFDELCPGIAHTTRIQTARMKDGNIECLFSFIRIGRKSQVACVSHSTAGVTASVNVDNGMITGAFYVDDDGNYITTDKHPDNNKSLNFEIPRWEEIINKCIEIHEYICELDYLGFDVIATNDSFKICEINSHSSTRSAQRSFPIWKNEKCKNFFSWKLNELKK